jgi:hypothetical protein
MNELISQIADHAQISEDAAKSALDSVIAYLRDKVPGPIFAQIEGYLGGEVSGESLMAGAKSAMGSLKKE